MYYLKEKTTTDPGSKTFVFFCSYWKITKEGLYCTKHLANKANKCLAYRAAQSIYANKAAKNTKHFS